MPWNRDDRPAWRIRQFPGFALFIWSAVMLAGQEAGAQSPAGMQTAAPATLVMIDPAHGGIESGALLNPAIPEKDVNLAFAQRLRREFITRGVVVQLMREEDTAVSCDQRAARANAVRPTLYMAIHSASLGSGVTVFSALLGSSEESSRGPFLDWETAQSSWIERSRRLADLIANSIHQAGLPVRALPAPLRPLGNVALPALAIEIAPTVGDIWQLVSPEYQQMIAAAVANAVSGALPSIRGQRGPTP